MFNDFNLSSSEPIAERGAVRAHLGETSPERRARIERLLARYPELEPAELAELVQWYRRDASAMDVALLASNEALTEPFGAFCRVHVAPFSWREKAITALLSAGVLGLFAFGLIGETA